MLASLVVLLLVFALGAALLASITALPFVVALDMADRRSFSSARWGLVQVSSLALTAVALFGAVRKHTSPWAVVLIVLAAMVAWLPPLVLSLLSGREELGGRAGAHEL